MSKNPRILIVEARFYDHISDALLEGATKALEAAGVVYDCVTVPGALEIPGIIAHAATCGKRQTDSHYDAYIALACVIRGETYHFDIVANESCRAVMDLTIHQNLVIGNGILTVENEAQALTRAKITELDKGGFAARAALNVMAARKHLAAAWKVTSGAAA